MTDYAQLVAEIVEGFERGEFETMCERHAAAENRGKGAGLKFWWPTLDGMIGRSRRVTESMQVANSPPVGESRPQRRDGRSGRHADLRRSGKDHRHRSDRLAARSWDR